MPTSETVLCRDLHASAAVIFLIALLLSFLPIDCVRADTIVHVIETWPPGEHITLGRNQNFYLRLAYETDKPVHIWARPYFHGKPAKAGSNPSQMYSGNGETFGWFFFHAPGDMVDEVRITAGDGSISNTPIVAVWRGDIVGGSEAPDAQTQPAWIAEMNARVKAVEDKARRTQMQKPVKSSDIALFDGFLLAVLTTGLSGLCLPAWGIGRWQGIWRIAAAVPAAMMAFVVLRIVVDGLRDPTSHNLWPFEILMTGSLSAGIMAILYLAHKLFGEKH
ncbi:MAG: hypothetical protein P0120_21400 [Nitrospira sp.]|nr:hypothetical protein [Nitrospira sp.]